MQQIFHQQVSVPMHYTTNKQSTSTSGTSISWLAFSNHQLAAAQFGLILFVSLSRIYTVPVKSLDTQVSWVAQWSKALHRSASCAATGRSMGRCTISLASSGLGRVWPVGISLSHHVLWQAGRSAR